MIIQLQGVYCLSICREWYFSRLQCIGLLLLNPLHTDEACCCPQDESDGPVTAMLLGSIAVISNYNTKVRHSYLTVYTDTMRRPVTGLQMVLWCAMTVVGIQMAHRETYVCLSRWHHEETCGCYTDTLRGPVAVYQIPRCIICWPLACGVLKCVRHPMCHVYLASGDIWNLSSKIHCVIWWPLAPGVMST